MENKLLPKKVVLNPKYQMDGNIIDDPMEKMQKKIIDEFKRAHDNFANDDRFKTFNAKDAKLIIHTDDGQHDITLSLFKE